MKLITRVSKARDLPAILERMYPEGTPYQEYRDKIAVIRALGSNPDPDEVDRILGNKSGTEVGECDECGQKVDAVVQLGEEPDYESHTACICEGCLLKAAALFKEKP